MKLRVIRAFWFAGKVQVPNAVVDIPDEKAARELIAVGKAEREAGQPAPVPGPMTTESVPEVVSGKVRKGAKDAQQ